MRKKIIICSLFCFFLMNICFLFLSNEILHAYADDITAINFEQNDNNWSDIVEPGIEVNSADKAATATLITGANDGNFTEIARKEDLTDVKYINNASYFLANPKHHENYANNPDNAAGTCTTVAMQMLIGYHNYYTDRRLIPETNGDSVRFLCSDYGNLLDNPIINHTMEAEQGRASIGTEDTVYREIYNLTWISDWYGIGQALGLVKDGAVQFINRYSTISNNVSFIKSDFSMDDVVNEINNGRPLIVGFTPIFTTAKSFHIVVAYGYAKLNGVNGLLVHYGWGDAGTEVWVPEAWLGSQLKLVINHEHNLVDSGENANRTYRKLICNECGYSTVEHIYEIANSTIIRTKYSLSGLVLVPTRIELYSPATASFSTVSISKIGLSAFENQTEITKVSLPAGITQIVDNAFV